MRKDLEQEIREVVKTVIMNKELKIEAERHLFSELGMDSLSFMKVITILEDKYDIEFSEQELFVDKNWTVSNLYRLVENHLDVK